MNTKSFKERFKESQDFEELVKATMAAAGKANPAGPFPAYTREQAEEIVLGWSNQLEAVGTVLRDKIKT